MSRQRKLPGLRSLDRKDASRDPKLKIIIVCEGEITEPCYLIEFSNDKRNSLVELHIIGGGGVPITVVDKAIQEIKKQKETFHKTGDSFEEKYEAWGVIDVDEHPNLPQAKQKARVNKVKLAISNPCFELWGLLHYLDHDAPIHRHKLQSKLQKKMPGYDAKKEKKFNYQDMSSSYKEASRRGKLMLKRRREEDNAGGNPSTDVHRLLDLIEKGRKKIKGGKKKV